jgi:hypothetical protein
MVLKNRAGPGWDRLVARGWRVALLAMAFVAAGCPCQGFNGQLGFDHPELLGGPWYAHELLGSPGAYRLWLFNRDTDGLYRTFSGGSAFTERFTWRVGGGFLFLKSRATGEQTVTAFRVDPDPDFRGRVRLTFAQDPRAEGRPTVWVRRRPARLLESASPGMLLDPKRFRGICRGTM